MKGNVSNSGIKQVPSRRDFGGGGNRHRRSGATMILGKSLASGAQLTIILVGIGVGGLIALTSTFFSLVIPSKVNGYGGCGCGKPETNR